MVVVVGATSGIIQAVMRQLATEGKYDFTLIGRNKNELQQTQKDLEIRDPTSTILLYSADDISNSDFISSTTAKAANSEMVFICIGMLPEQNRTQQDLQYLEHTFKINALIPILWLEAFASRSEHRRNCTIGIMSSVAGDRGRKSNYCYGAAKSLIDTYVQGLQHRFHKTNKSFVLIKPGPTKSRMTLHLAQSQLADPAKVANDIIKAMRSRKSIIYTPLKWWAIMLVIKSLPRQVFNRTSI